MQLHFRQLIIALAAGGPFEDMVLVLELIILGLELANLFRMGLRKLFDRSGPTVCTALRNNIDQVLFNRTSIRALQSSRTIVALGTELLRLNNSLWAEDTGPESQNSGDLGSLPYCF